MVTCVVGGSPVYHTLLASASPTFDMRSTLIVNCCCGGNHTGSTRGEGFLSPAGTGLRCRFARVRCACDVYDESEFEELEGITGGFYQPSVDDVGCRIIVECTSKVRLLGAFPCALACVARRNLSGWVPHMCALFIHNRANARASEGALGSRGRCLPASYVQEPHKH